MSATVSRRAVLASLSAFVAGAGRAGDPRVAVGLERVESGEGSLRGRRVGLVCHSASVTAGGRHAIDVLRGAGAHVARLFAPEHGLRGRAAAGEPVVGGVDAATGLPVVSLYSDAHAPTTAQLGDLDALVVDLQDAGVRFYTYVSTALLCLDPAAAAGVEVVVLDRPNPLGGEHTAGPERDPSRPFRLVSVAPGPLVHGLSLGEMLLFANRRRSSPVRVRVVPLAGWERPMTWLDTGRDWTPPSPNLRTAEAALVYPGTCLLEGTNVSEGRGTDAPFLLLGAPWLRAEEVAAAASSPGLALEPCRFAPAPGPAAPRPKHAGVECAGVRVRVTDPRAVRPWAFGLSLVSAIRRLHSRFEWLADGAVLDGLLGTDRIRRALERRDAVEDILAADRSAVERFERERSEVLLY